MKKPPRREKKKVQRNNCSNLLADIQHQAIYVYNFRLENLYRLNGGDHKSRQPFYERNFLKLVDFDSESSARNRFDPMKTILMWKE